MATHDGTTADPVLAMARDSAGAATVEVRSGRNRDFVYDGAGRVTAIKGASVHGPPATSPVLVSLNFDNSGQPPTGTETVMRVATTQAGSFNYFYDAQNRRVRKQYPNGDLDGFFWGDGRELLMETSPTSINGGKRTMDEYLWLAGRPVVTIRSKYDSSASWTRFPGAADWYTDCARRDEAGTCRPNAIISDVIGKPIATLDSSRKVAGVLEYDPFGHINRAEHWGEIAPAQNGGCWWVTFGMRQGMGPLAREVRAMVPRVDLNDYVPGVKGGCIGQYKSTPWQQPSSAPAGNDFCGPKTDYRFPWTTLADNEGLHVLYCSYENNISPQPFGVTVRGYEYRKREVGTSAHYLPPFRFPGQYFDAETDLYENWNRYYDPSTGRYLSPEPLLQSPSWVAWELQGGHQTPGYGYASNNPVGNFDPNGLEVRVGPESPRSRAAYEVWKASGKFDYIWKSLENDKNVVFELRDRPGFGARGNAETYLNGCGPDGRPVVYLDFYWRSIDATRRSNKSFSEAGIVLHEAVHGQGHLGDGHAWWENSYSTDPAVQESVEWAAEYYQDLYDGTPGRVWWTR